MSDTERHPAQVAMGRKTAALKQQNEERRQKQRHRPPESSGRDHKRRPQPQRRRQDNARTEASDGEDDSDGEPDSLVPDRIVARELGVSVMSLWRRSNDPEAGFPAPIKINGRNFRSRKQLEAYKAAKLKEAMHTHHARLNVRRRVPLPVS